MANIFGPSLIFMAALCVASTQAQDSIKASSALSGTYSVNFTWTIEGASFLTIQQSPSFSALYTPVSDIVFRLEMACCDYWSGLKLKTTFTNRSMRTNTVAEFKTATIKSLDRELFADIGPVKGRIELNTDIQIFNKAKLEAGGFFGRIRNLSNPFPDDTIVIHVELLVGDRLINRNYETFPWRVPVCGFGIEAAALVSNDMELGRTYLHVGGKNLPIPRALLATKSPYFKQLLLNMTKDQKDLIIRMEGNEDYESMAYLVQFSYAETAGPVPVGKERALIKMGAKYGIEGLKKAAEKYLAAQITKETAVSMLNEAEELKASQLKIYVTNRIRKQALTMGGEEWANYLKELNLEFCSAESTCNNSG